MAQETLPRVDVLETAAAWRDAGRRVALATVAETWGSAPRPVGSKLVVDAAGNFEGSVSGGCVEGAVIAEAADVISDARPRLLTFGVADETAWQVGLSCGGKISVLLEPMEGENGAGSIIAAVNAARRQRLPVAIATEIATGRSRMVLAGDSSDDGSARAVSERLLAGASGLVDLPAGQTMVTAFLPPPQAVLLGAVHIAQALAPMALSAGFDVTVVDPRTAFATAERFPGVRVLAAWPEDVAAELHLDPFTAFAALTHDPKIDDPGIEAAIAATCFYIGALGSRNTNGKRLDRLRARGLPEASLTAIHAPIGLQIGAESPAEIAVAVLAEMISARRGPVARRREFAS